MIYDNMAKELMQIVASDKERALSVGNSNEKPFDSMADIELLMALSSSKSKAKAISDANLLCDTVLTNSIEKAHDIETFIKAGVPEDMARKFLAVLEFCRRHRRDFVIENKATICNPGDIFREVRHYAHSQQENFVVLVLNGAHEVINSFVATTGLVNKTLVHPREVFADAISRRACAIAIAHNHPSGALEPSDDDIEVTNRLKMSGGVLGIKLLDHLVFTLNGYFSFLEHGLL